MNFLFVFGVEEMLLESGLRTLLGFGQRFSSSLFDLRCITIESAKHSSSPHLVTPSHLILFINLTHETIPFTSPLPGCPNSQALYCYIYSDSPPATPSPCPTEHKMLRLHSAHKDAVYLHRLFSYSYHIPDRKMFHYRITM